MSRSRLLVLITTTLTTLLTATLALVGGVGAAASTPTTGQAAGARRAAAVAPRFRVVRVVGGLKIPWDLTWVRGLMLFDQRAGGVWSKSGSGRPQRVRMALPRIYAHSESGMLGMVADPLASSNHMFYTCMAVATNSGGPRDVEVWKWQLTSNTSARRIRTMIKGLPLHTGRHSGCRLRFRSTHMLYVGTGDSARGTNAQDLQSLGGKILRVRDDGRIPVSNPFYRHGGNARYVWNYGHRNVQGLARRPGSGQMWSVEHGPNRDDEVNQVWVGRNYGWNPVPGYNESRPMTDLRHFPHAVRARWSSGYPTKATSGATFLSGARWRSWNGLLAVAMLKGQGILLFTVGRADHITGHLTICSRTYGRIRTVQQGPDGNLWFTTSNGSGDGIFRLTPA